MKFYNRKDELSYLKKYIQLEPNSILFVYGPKSSGKSTLIKKVIEEINKEKDDIIFFYYNLRKYATPTKEEFLNVFFSKSDKKYLQNTLELNLKIFKFGIDENYDFKNVTLNDVFTKINEDINAVVEEGKKPILIIDELQKLKNIFFNEGKSLLNELFNLFVSLTKMEHLCHVICLTSDSLFIEEVYTNSSLANASRFYLVDWLKKEDIEKILKEEGFNKDEINYALNYLSLPYEIVELINNKKIGLKVKETINRWIEEEKNKLIFQLNSMEYTDEAINFFKKFKNQIKINHQMLKKKEFETLKLLADMEILFYDIVGGEIKPISLITYHAINKII